jgi:CRISPR-associated endonuclease/helicase Cas3
MMITASDPKAYREAQRCNYRHEIAALWLVEQMAQALGMQYGPVPGNGLLEVVAVAGHHRYLADGYLFDEERFRQELTWKPDAFTMIKPACGLAHLMFKQQGWRLPQKIPGVDRVTIERNLSNGEINFPFVCLEKAKNQLACEVQDRDYRLYRDLFVLLKGLLMGADWMASGAIDDPDMLDVMRSIVRVSADSLTHFMKTKVEGDRQKGRQVKPFGGFRTFQTQCGNAEGHVLAIAPTGSGKTEAALLWALNQVEKGHARKLFYLLPTMVTANSLYKRISAFFVDLDHAVGLVHSTADLVPGDQKQIQDESEADKGNVRAKLFRTTHFFLPVTVGTIDQLLVSLFHAGRWALKTFQAADAAIVIDEVHAYDPHTSGLVTLFLKQFRDLGARFMVMSATMPTNLQNTILDALEAGAEVGDTKNVGLIKDADLLNEARNFWKICETPLTEWLKEKTEDGKETPSAAIRNLLAQTNDRGECQRILIVVNTVKRCQEIARLLADFQAVCYHSKFIFQDRREKEHHINECQPPLVVATQVVEVSLDIDYDVLLTECAPFDALVQRAGRVNRTRRETRGKVIVFPAEPGSEKVYSEPEGVLEASWNLCEKNQRPLTEQELIELVEQTYTGRVLSEHTHFVAVQTETVAAQRRLSGVLDNPHPEEDDHLKTRLEKYHQVSVIPEPLAEEALKVCPSWDRRLFELQMPYWYVRANKSERYSDDLPLCKMGYDPILGAQFLNKGLERDPACCII